MANIKTSELTIKDSPSTSATLVGVDNGETVQIPSNVFAKPSDIPSLAEYAKKTDLFSKSYNDLTDKPTIPSAYSHPSTHPASMITDLATVATSGSYNDLTNKPTIPSIEGLATTAYVDDKISSLPSGGGSSSSSNSKIIPVDALPTENIDTSAIYLVTEPELVGAKLFLGSQDMSLMGDFTVELVDELPSNPRVVTDIEFSYTYVYWLTSDNSCSGYIDEEFASMTGVSSGWYPIDALLTTFGYPYGGVIESIDEATNEEAFYVLTVKADKRILYHYKNGAFAKMASFATTSDIVATPNPCIYKVREIDEFHIVTLETDENSVVVNVHMDDLDGTYVYTEVVNELPEVMEAFIREDGTVYMYYNRVDGLLYVYATEDIAATLEMPVGWMPFEDVSLIESLEDATDSELIYGLVTKKPHLYYYDGDDWLEIPTGFRMVHNPKLETITFIES